MRNAVAKGVWPRVLAVLALGFGSGFLLPSTGWAQERINNETVHEQDLSAQSAARHHYNSPAERAEDDLLIVKVKAAIADAELAEDYPLTVDADHGRVTLTGVLASSDAVQRAVALVENIDGVKGVNNRLTWAKHP
jgi:osmotically-inducible protein OsmY